MLKHLITIQGLYVTLRLRVGTTECYVNNEICIYIPVCCHVLPVVTIKFIAAI